MFRWTLKGLQGRTGGGGGANVKLCVGWSSVPAPKLLDAVLKS